MEYRPIYQIQRSHTVARYAIVDLALDLSHQHLAVRSTDGQVGPALSQLRPNKIQQFSCKYWGRFSAIFR